MPRLAPLCALPLLAAAVLALLAPAPASAARGCGVVEVGAQDVHVRVLRGRVTSVGRSRSCAATRATTPRAARAPAPPACGRYGAWHCQGAAAFAWPRLMSCSSGRRVVAAYHPGE